MSRGKLTQQIPTLLSTEHLATAPKIIESLASAGFEYNKTSVYRALERLLESGEICRTSLGSQETYYELRHHDHAHLICNTCHRVSATSAISVPQNIEGFTTDHSHITIFGVCGDCQQT